MCVCTCLCVQDILYMYEGGVLHTGEEHGAVIDKAHVEAALFYIENIFCAENTFYTRTMEPSSLKPTSKQPLTQILKSQCPSIFSTQRSLQHTEYF